MFVSSCVKFSCNLNPNLIFGSEGGAAVVGTVVTGVGDVVLTDGEVALTDGEVAVTGWRKIRETGKS